MDFYTTMYMYVLSHSILLYTCITDGNTSDAGKDGEDGDGGDGGDAGEYDESGSVTVTELSGEEEIEEYVDDSEEDTMFEKTLTQSGIQI